MPTFLSNQDSGLAPQPLGQLDIFRPSIAYLRGKISAAQGALSPGKVPSVLKMDKDEFRCLTLCFWSSLVRCMKLLYSFFSCAFAFGKVAGDVSCARVPPN